MKTRASPGAGSAQAQDSAEKRPSWVAWQGLQRKKSVPGDPALPRQDPSPTLSAGHLGRLLHLPGLSVPIREVGTLMPTLWH